MINKIFNIITILILAILLAIISDVFMIWMPMGIQMAVLLSATVLVGVWVALIMNEKTNDEREFLHKLKASRIAYLSGIIVLTLALIFQCLEHKIDPWISTTLLVMVLSKLVTRIYSEFYK